MSHVPQQVIKECKQKLIDMRADLMNRMRTSRQQFIPSEVGGDEADQTVRLLAENELLATQQMIRMQILEIDLALARMDKGTYGLCEETEQPIELERLKTIPWTRLSIEGAEIREAQRKRFAR